MQKVIEYVYTRDAKKKLRSRITPRNRPPLIRPVARCFNLPSRPVTCERRSRADNCSQPHKQSPSDPPTMHLHRTTCARQPTFSETRDGTATPTRTLSNHDCQKSTSRQRTLAPRAARMRTTRRLGRLDFSCATTSLPKSSTTQCRCAAGESATPGKNALFHRQPASRRVGAEIALTRTDPGT